MARRILTHRTANGPFPSRAALMSIPGMDETTYRQAAAFLRVPDSEMPLDRTWIHPESCPVVEKIAAALQVGIAELLGKKDLIDTLRIEEYADGSVGLPTLEWIRRELLSPGKDPRGAFAPPRFHAEIRDISNLKEGMTLEGSVTNVTNFGAFVDIGIHQDGLVHLSQMSNRFIRDPREAVKVGDLVQVKVISVEVETKRIGLSMKALLPAIPRRRKKPRRREAQPPQGVPAAAVAAEGAADATGAPASTPEASRERSGPRPTHREPRPQRPPRTGPPPEKRGEHRPRRGDRPRRNEPQGAKGETPAGRPVEVPPLPPQPEAEPEPKGPEPTLQEKIAILQSKFRGIH